MVSVRQWDSRGQEGSVEPFRAQEEARVSPHLSGSTHQSLTNSRAPTCHRRARVSMTRFA
jgi:hypothetical protein